MIAASKCLKQFAQWESKMGIYSLLSTPSFRNLVGVRRQLQGKKRIANFNKLLNGHMQHPSCRKFRSSNYYYIRSSSVKISWIWTLFVIPSAPVDNFQSVLLSTQTSSSEDEAVDEILNQVLSAIETTPSCSKEICTSYIEELCRANKLSVAARLQQSLHDKHIFLSPHAYDLLLEAAREENDADLLSQVFKDALVSCKCMSSSFYLNLARGFTKMIDSVLLLRFVREVSERTFPRSATVVNRIIYAFAECGQFEKSLLIFHQLKTVKCEPDLVTYNTVLGILGRTSRIDEMLHEFGSMKEANISPDIISYNTLLNSLRKVGRLDLCLEFFKEMTERGIEPDLRTYTAMIESFGQSGNIEESLRLFNQMKLKRIRPSTYIYRSLINYLKKMGKLELAMTFAEEMNECLPDLVSPKDFKRKDR